MAGSNEVTYTIRLKDQMTKRLKAMGLSANKFSASIKSKLVGALKLARVAMKGLAIAAGLATAAMGAIVFAAVRAGKSFVEAASLAEETRSKFSAVFKESAEEATIMADSISSAMGRNQTETMGFMARLQDTFVPMGVARDKAMGMSGALVRVAHDLAAMNPEAGGAKAVMDNLASTMIGSHEAAYKFGIIINETTLKEKLLAMGAEKANGAFSEQDKAMARLQIIIESTTDAQGYAIKNQDTWMNSTERLKSQMTGLREEMGDKLIGVLQSAIAEMGGVDAIVKLARTGMTFFVEVLTQMVIPAITNMTKNAGGMITALGGVGEATDTVAMGISVMANAFKTAWAAIKLVLYYLNQGFDTLSFAFKAAWDVLKLLTGLLALGLVTAFLETAKVLAFLFEGMDKFAGFLRDTFISMLQFVIDKLADLVSGFGSALAFISQAPGMGFLSGMAQSAENAANAMRGLGVSMEGLKGGDTWYKDMADGLKEIIPGVEQLQESVLGFVNESWEGLSEHTSEYVDAIMEDIPTIAALWEDVSSGAAATQEEYLALTDRVQEALAKLNEMEVITPEQKDTTQDMIDHLEGIAAGLGKVGAAEDELIAKSTGLAAVFEHIGGAATNFATNSIPSMAESMTSMTEGAITNFANGMTDALMSVVDGSMSAKDAFKEFAAQFLMSIAQMIIQSIVFAAIRTALGIPPGVGLADGGIVGGGLGSLTPLASGGVVGGGMGRLMPLKGYANGGPIVSGPHVALVGEGRHNEAVVPLPDGKSIPVDMSGAPETAVNINISAVDAAGVDKLLFDRRNTLKNIISEAIGSSRSFRGAVGRA